jgi:hypothetical protein
MASPQLDNCYEEETRYFPSYEGDDESVEVGEEQLKGDFSDRVANLILGRQNVDQGRQIEKLINEPIEVYYNFIDVPFPSLTFLGSKEARRIVSAFPKSDDFSFIDVMRNINNSLSYYNKTNIKSAQLFGYHNNTNFTIGLAGYEIKNLYDIQLTSVIGLIDDSELSIAQIKDDKSPNAVIRKLLETDRQNINQAVDDILSYVDELLHAGQLSTINEFLHLMASSKDSFSIDALIAALSITLCEKEKLSSRIALYDKTRLLVESNCREDEREFMLIGLG